MRDRERLKAALSQIDAPCPYRDECKAYVYWDAIARQHRIKIIHPDEHDPAMAPGVFRDRADSYLISLLELHGVRVAHYAEDNLVPRHAVR